MSCAGSTSANTRCLWDGKLGMRIVLKTQAEARNCKTSKTFIRNACNTNEIFERRHGKLRFCTVYDAGLTIFSRHFHQSATTLTPGIHLQNCCTCAWWNAADLHVKLFYPLGSLLSMIELSHMSNNVICNLQCRFKSTSCQIAPFTPCCHCECPSICWTCWGDWNLCEKASLSSKGWAANKHFTGELARNSSIQYIFNTVHHFTWGCLEGPSEMLGDTVVQLGLKRKFGLPLYPWDYIQALGLWPM